MTIHIELSHDLESRLQANAQREGQDMDSYVMKILEAAASPRLPSESGEAAGLSNRPRTRSLLEFEGLGAELWQGIDAQEYVNQLRAEWDHRP